MANIVGLQTCARLGAGALVALLCACGENVAENPTPDAGVTPSADAGTIETDAGTDAGLPVDEPLSAADYAAIVMAAPWASDMTLDFAEETLTIMDDGIPDRGVLELYAVPDGTTTPVVASPYSHAIPMQPVLAAQTTETNLGAIGVTLSGGLLFNPYDGGGEVAIDMNFVADGVPFIDPCNGHPVGTGMQYHYHGVPYCITDTIDEPGAHSSLLGVLLDGFPLYGSKEGNDEAPSDLDACNGHTGPTPEFPAGIYHYHLSEVSPYSIQCFSGEVVMNGGGPGGGPQVMDCTDPPTGGGCCGDGVCDGPETTDNCSEDCM